MEELDPTLIVRSLNYHGQQLTKLWDCEQGGHHLAQLNITTLDYQAYKQRQKGLIFQERVKRLQLHEFIARNAKRLFHNDLTQKEEVKIIENKSKKAPLQKYAQLPPYELFLDIDKSKRVKHFFEYATVGSIIVGTIISMSGAGVSLRLLYLESAVSDAVIPIPDLNIKAFCSSKKSIPIVDNINRVYQVNDNLRCEILELVPDTEKFIVGMRGSVCAEDQKGRLGLMPVSDFHVAYRVFMEYNKKDSYPEVLEKSAGFYNPKNVDNLSNELQLGSDKTPSHFMELKGQVPESELAPELRQQQANKWSMKSVAEGIGYFKAGKFAEAFQCLNKALSIDPNNVEGLTARGALYANNGNFSKAIGDFETALKINPAHVNARKYLGETLVARGRSLEEETKYDDAIKSYEACLRIVPFHEEATNSIKYLKEKMELDDTDLTSSLPPLNISSKVNDVKATLKQLLAEEKEREGKKKKEKKKRKRQSSSSSSSSSSDDLSSDSSLSSSSSDTSQDSTSKKKKKKKKNKERSLSPLSKRMAGSVQGNGLANRTYNNPPATSSNLMGIFDSVSQPVPGKCSESEYDLRVTQFLEQTKGDNDYEEKVRKFLEETAKWKKEQRLKEKKKRKKEKKSKDKVKKKKREDKRKRKLEEKKLKEQANDFRAKTGLAALGVSELQSIQSKISEFYSRMNKPPSPTPTKKKETQERSSKKSKHDHSSGSSDSEGGGDADKSPPRKGGGKKNSSGSKRADTPQGKASAGRPRSRSGSADRKKVDIFADSPPQSKNDRNESSSGSKFKMQMQSSNKVKKDIWSNDEEPEEDRHYTGGDKKKDKSPPPPVERHKVMNMGIDKLGGFRINLDAQKKKKHDSGSDSDNHSPDRKKKKRKRDSRSSTRSRSKKRSSSRSSSSSYANKRSYRKRYHSSDSRSRSRSGSRSRSYSRSRSRSYSPHGSRRGHRGNMTRGGTYYKPRPYYHTPRGGGYVPRGRGRGNPRGYDNYRGGRGGYIPRGRGGYQNYNNGHSRPRYFHYKTSGPRDGGSYYSNTGASGGRYEKRPRSPRDEEDESPMRKVNAEKQRIDRMIEKHPSGPLSEGEERDDEDGELR